MSDRESEYRALSEAAGFVVLPPRTLIEMTGADRQKFLHSFCTADIKTLLPGDATEAFVLNGKGKILAHVLVLALEDKTLLSGAGAQASTLIDHLDKYIIRDDVQLRDASAETGAIFVTGPHAGQAVLDLLGTAPSQDHVLELEPVDRDSEPLSIIANVEVAGFGSLFLIPKNLIKIWAEKLAGQNIPPCSESVLQLVRIQHQTPWFGLDMDDRNLPQELQRDGRAISFDKGCYLGQETVARIDAMGHVNQLLVGLTFSADSAPNVGAELMLAGKSVGRITSVAQTVNSETIGLGYVRRVHSKPNTTLEFDGGVATVVT